MHPESRTCLGCDAALSGLSRFLSEPTPSLAHEWPCSEMVRCRSVSSHSTKCHLAYKLSACYNVCSRPTVYRPATMCAAGRQCIGLLQCVKQANSV
eukprot:122152-Chlamydomonas_euryale.AAC.1